MNNARGDGLSPEERAKRGFVQGRMDESTLAKFEAGPGVFLAHEDGVLAGFAMTSDTSTFRGGPPKETVDAARAELGDRRMFMYGPAAVDSRLQGRGVLTSLLTAVSRTLQNRFELGIAFVEDANRKSLAVHRHYGMTEVPGFEFDGRDYHVFAFAPSLFTER